jgi:hypothetical protein
MEGKRMINVIQFQSTDDQSKDHTFIEIEPDGYLEIDTDTLDQVNREAINQFINAEQKARKFSIQTSERYFKLRNLKYRKFQIED